MKEASGTTYLTVITIVAIGVVVALGLFLIPRLNNNTNFKSCCADAGGKWSGNQCKPVSGVIFDQANYTNCTAK